MQYALRLLNRDPAWMAVFVSLFLSVVVVMTDDLINSDGIVYTEVAGKILGGDWQGAIAHHSWPFYPLLIAMLSKISFLNFEITAHVINALLLGLLAYVFVRCSQIMGGDRRVAIFAGILLLTNVSLNGYRDLIIRDFGYWAFFFTALFFFLQYNRTRLTKYALGFGISIIMATLFRIEGIVFALLAPLILIIQSGSWKERLYRGILPLLPLIVVGGAAIVLMLFISPSLIEKLSSSVHADGQLLGPLNYLQTSFQGVVQGIVEKGRLIEEVVLDINARNMGTESVVAILIMMLVLKIISASGYIPLFFAGWTSFSSRLRHSMTDANVIAGFMLINLLVLITVVMTRTFLSPRYAMTLALLISIPAAFGLADFFRTQSFSTWHRRGKIILTIVLVYMFLDGITSFSSSKAYIKESGLWLKKNIPAEARLFSNEGSLYYYSGRKVNRNIVYYTFSATHKAQLPSNEPITSEPLEFDYVAIKIGRKQTGFEEKVIAWVGSQPIYRAGNERGDKVLIFSLNK